jgi:hypothetical protein
VRKVHVECKPDQVLAMFLGVTRKRIVHHNDKGRVCRELKTASGCIAMFDEDPESAQPGVLKTLTFDFVASGIKAGTDPSGNTILILCPRLEEWVVKIAGESKIHLRDFYLPEKPKDLHKSINSQIAQFKNLLEAIESAKNPSILKLRQYLKA